MLDYQYRRRALQLWDEKRGLGKESCSVKENLVFNKNKKQEVMKKGTSSKRNK